MFGTCSNTIMEVGRPRRHPRTTRDIATRLERSSISAVKLHVDW